MNQLSNSSKFSKGQLIQEQQPNHSGWSSNHPEPTYLLPRGAWQSRLAYLKAMLKAKQQLDAESRHAD